MRSWLKVASFGIAMAGLGALVTALALADGPTPVVAAAPGAPTAIDDRLPQAAPPQAPLASRNRAEPASPATGAMDRRELEAAREEIAQLRRELGELKRRAELEKAVTGAFHPTVDPDKPLPWPEAMPPEHRPAGFAQVIAELKRACPALGSAVLATRCDEPPCIVALAHDDDQLSSDRYKELTSCEPWRKAFGTGVSMSPMRDGCDAGASRSLVLFSPFWNGWDDEPPSVKAVMQKHLRQRWSGFASLSCK